MPGEKLYFAKTKWISSTKKHPFYRYELYRKLNDDYVESETIVSHNLYIDMSNGDAYEYISSIDEDLWIEKYFNDTVKNGTDYEELHNTLVSNEWLKMNAFGIVRALLKRFH